MITTNNRKFYEKAKDLRNLCFGKKDRFNHSSIGWNYRMSNLQASLGLGQLNRINSIIKKRHSVGRMYYQLLKDNEKIFIPKPKNKYSKNIYWIIGVVIKKKKLNLNAKTIMSKLQKYNIGSRPFFWPMNKQDIFKKFSFYNSKSFKNSEYLSKYGFYLPSSLNISNREIRYICKCLNNITNK